MVLNLSALSKLAVEVFTMNQKPSAWESFVQFLSGKGFYLVVLLCLAAIGVSGYFLVRSAAHADEDETASTVVNATQVPETARPAVSAAPSASPSPTSAPKASAAPAPTPVPSPSAAPEPSPSPTLNPASRVFTWPVNGTVVTSYSVETLLYDATMLDWRTHEGLDMAVDEGTRVLATAAGTVSDLYDDELMGTTIVIDHGDGLTSVYANLSPETNVSPGDAVYTGDIIGAVGSTASAESGLDPHLHFAMFQDGEPVDPEMYLPD